MLTETRKSFSETFVIWNDNINLVGALIPSNKGRASVSGMNRFKNGEKLSFSYKSDNRKIVHQKLMSLCQHIAKFYGTNVVHRKDCAADSVNATPSLLRKGHHLLN